MGPNGYGPGRGIGGLIMGLLGGASAALQGYNTGQERRRQERERHRSAIAPAASAAVGLREKFRQQFENDTGGGWPEPSGSKSPSAGSGAGGPDPHFGLAPGWLGPLSSAATGTGPAPGFLARLRTELNGQGPAPFASERSYPFGSDTVAQYVRHLQASAASPSEISTAVSRRFGGKWT